MTWTNRIVGQGSKPASEFQANPRNWRTHPESQRRALQAILAEVGWVQNVIENVRTGHLIDGHERVWSALKNDDADVPYIQVDISEEEEQQILAVFDPISAMATTDREKLEELLRGIETDNAAMSELLADIAAKANIQLNGRLEDPGPEIDRAEELRQKWGVELGQLWRLGRHRLVCGDCTDEAIVDLLMDGKFAETILTDPPYGINREGIPNDDPDGLRALFDGCLAILPAKNAVVISFQSPRLEWVWLDAIRVAGHKPERLLWMYKRNDVTNVWRGWLLTSEAIRVSSLGKPRWPKHKNASHDCYLLNWDKDTFLEVDGWHASIKPLPVVENLLSHTSGDVYDPFVGSGTTIIAAEQLDRTCYALDIDPAYCAVAIERWHQATGQQPQLLEQIEHLKNGDPAS